MKKVAVVALKGGVGKSSVVAGLGLALVIKKFKVGFLDIDITGSNLFTALGLQHSPKWGLDTAHERVIVPEVNGYWLLSIASHVGEEYAVLWEGSHHSELSQARTQLIALKDMIALAIREPKAIEEVLDQVSREIDDVLASSKWRFVSELLSEEKVTWPKPLDFLIADLPPSTISEMFSFFEQVKDLFGVIIVSQPAKISTIGLLRTIDLLRQKQIPIIGLVANQDGFLNRHGEIEYQFLSPRVDLQGMARGAGIPFLASIPQCGDGNKIKPYFSELAEKVINSKPIVLKEVTIGRKLKRKVVKGIARRL
jgi:ATP-binding protein involved in chromosome partitioning